MRSSLVAGFILLAVMCLLFANEIFLNQPVMTSQAQVPQATGAWKDGTDIVLNIALDGAVSGHIGQFGLQGTFAHNRTWFGRAMKLRTDYVIRDALSDGRPVSIPLHWTGQSYKGSLFIGPNFKATGPTGIELTRS